MIREIGMGDGVEREAGLGEKNVVRNAAEIPEFASEAEEAEFWATHALGEGLLEKMERRNRILEEREYSGKVLLRMPRSLHRDLSHRAEEENASLNQLIVTALARFVGTGR